MLGIACTLVLLARMHTHPGSCAVRYTITAGNDNNGQPAFDVHPLTGKLSVASEHDYERTRRVYNLTITLTDDGTAAYGPPSWVVPFNVTAIMVDVNERPLFQTTPNSSVSLNGPCASRCVTGPQRHWGWGLWGASCRPFVIIVRLWFISPLCRLCHGFAENTAPGSAFFQLPLPDDPEDPLAVNITYRIIGACLQCSLQLDIASYREL